MNALKFLPLLLWFTLRALAQTPLTYDPGDSQAGTQVYTHPNANAGAYTFSVVIPAGSVEGVRFRLNVAAGDANLYVRQGAVPTTSSYNYASTFAGSDLIGLSPGQYSAGQTWYILVHVPAGATWTLLAGDAALTLTWDPGTTSAGTAVYTHPAAETGDFWFRIPAQASANGGWRTALTVTSGEAHVYARLSNLPSASSWTHKSDLAGSDGWVLRPDQFAAAQEWFLLVRATTAAGWSLVTGDVHVQDLGALGFTDTNGNTQYDIGEAITPGGSGAVSVGPEGMRFFKATVPAGTPAWSLWLNGDTRDLAIRKTTVPFHPGTNYYDRKQSGQMLVVPPYLGTGSNVYFLSVTGSPGTAINLDSRIQQVTDIAFNATVPAVNVPGPPYRVYRTQVPVDQIAWDVNTTAHSGNPNVCVRQTNVPAEFDNEGFSEAPGSTRDSVSLVPDFLTNGTWFITVYGTGAYNFTLFSGDPTITPIQYTDNKVNDQTTRAGWRYYALTDIPSQVGTLGWELLLSNHVPGSMIAIRRNKVPSRWHYRSGGSTFVYDTATNYVDFSGSGGFLQRPGHQADVWYVGVFTAGAALGAFELDTHAIAPPTVGFNGTSTAVNGLEPGRWRFQRVDVPAGVLGWDLRLRNLSGGGTPQLVVRRDQLPAVNHNTGWSYPHSNSTWPSGYTVRGTVDWSGRVYDTGAPTYQTSGEGLVLSTGRPLEPGTYYVGVFNGHATNNSTCTVESRGIGTGQAITVGNLNFAAGSSAAVTNLARREAAYYKVTVPANTPNWEFTLTPTTGEMMLAARRGGVPDFAAYPYGWGGGGYIQDTAVHGDWQTEVQKTGPERYLLLPDEDDDYILEGDYYVAVISEGVAPPDASTIGTGTSSGTLTSNGAIPITDLGAASAGGLTQPVTLAGAQVKACTFTVPAGTASLEVRLDNRIGNPVMALIGGTRVPRPNGYATDFGWNYGEYYPPAGGAAWRGDDDLITIANPPTGSYTLALRADPVSSTWPDATADLVVIANAPAPLPFDGGSLNVSGQSPEAWRYFQVTVPAGVLGWDIRVKNITAGTPGMAVRRDQLPASTGNSGWSYPQSTDNWPTGNAVGAALDWTGRTYDTGAPTYTVPGPRLVLGMGRPLEPGTYLVGVYNSHASQAAAYTIESRGIGTGQTIPVGNLNFAAGSSVTITSLPRREAAYYKVTVPANTASWEFTLTPTTGEMMMAVRRGTVPDFFCYPISNSGGGDVQATAVFGDRQAKVLKTGPERYFLLPLEDQDFITPGDYYIAAVSEGVSPPDASTIGTGNSSGTLTSNGVIPVIGLGTASPGGLTQAVTLAGAQVKTYSFTIPAGTASLEVRLDNRTGNPRMALIGGPRPALPGYYYCDFGYSNGEYYPPAGALAWRDEDDLITVANPPAGLCHLSVRASAVSSDYPNATADLVVVANAPVPLAFDGGTAVVSGVAATAWRYYEVTVPAGVMGWDIRLSNVTSGDPQMVVRRDQLPAHPNNHGWSYPQSTDNWPAGHAIGGTYDWSGRYYDIGWPTYQQVPDRLVLGMGRPLEPGTYIVGVYNSHNTQTAAFTVESRGIGTGQTLPITTLSFNAGVSSTITGLARREAAYYKVTIPAGQPAWEFTLGPTNGEMMLAVRRGTIPDFFVYPTSYGGGGELQSTSTFGDRQCKVQKAGPERLVLLPAEDQDTLLAGDYYFAVISEGVNPPESTTIGTGSSSGVFTLAGPLATTALGAVTPAGSTTPLTLAGAQARAFSFTVPAGTHALEVRLDNRVGNPRYSFLPGTRLPVAEYIYADMGYNGGELHYAPANLNTLYDDSLVTLIAPPPGDYRLVVRAAVSGSTFPDASANLIVRQHQRQMLNFDVTQNGNGFSHTDTRQLLDTQKHFYEVQVPAVVRGSPVIGWLLKVNHAQGDTTLRIHKTWAGTGGVTFYGNTALIVPPWLTLNEPWYVEVTAAGLTNYTITSQPVLLERNPWTMPATHNVTFGDSGVDNLGVPLPGDRGVDVGEDDWHFYAVDVPAGNAGLLRTELTAINGNPNLYIREDGVPTTDHLASGPNGASLIHRSLTATQSEYGNWVPINGRYEKELRPGRWYLAVKATGGTNARYRLRASTGQVTDLALSGGSATAQTLVGRDWRYYRFTVPLDAPNTWSLTFSQTVGDVVMFLRDSLPPGQGADGLESADNGPGYTWGLRTWYGDSKNQGPYAGAGHDAAGTYNFTTPPLRPAHTYYVGFKANNDATFTVSSAVSGGTTGALPVLAFYNGTVNTSIPAGASLLYRIPVPVEATRLKWTSTHPSSVQLRLEQGTLPGTTGSQHWTSSGGANTVFNQPLTSPNNWPWQPQHDYYLRAMNTSGSAQTLVLTMNGVNATTEDEDNDTLPDAWELTYYPGIGNTNGSGDTDGDGSTAAQEFANGTNPADFASAKYTAALNGLHGTAGKLPNILLHDRATNVTLTNSADAGYTFLGWLRGERLDTQFAVRATGSVTIPAAGTWTFGLESRGGTRLKVNGVTVLTDNTTYDDADTFAAVAFPAAGNYPVELTAYDYYGQGDLELFAAAGTHAAFNAGFKLVGDTAAGGLAVPGGFALRQVTAGGTQVVNTFAIADSLLAGTIVSKGDTTLNQPVLNHRTTGGVDGSFPNGALFPLQQWHPASPLSEPMLRHSTFHALNTIPLATALDTTGLTWTNTGGDAPWLAENAATSFDTVDQAYSPPILDNQSAIMGITVEGPGVLTFRWKVNSQSGDYLRLYQNASNVQNITGDVPWTLATYNVPSGTHYMNWRYTKDGSGSAGSDRGWVDSVNWAPTRYTLTVNAAGGTVTKNPDLAEYLPGTVVQLTALPAPGNTFISYSGDLNTPLNPSNITMHTNRTVTANFNTVGSAVDAPGQAWSLSNSPGTIAANWFTQSTTTHDGADAAQSGAITHGQFTAFQTTVTGPNTLTFWWKVSSEATNDPLRFLIDGVEQHRISGEQNWVQRTYNIAAGNHTLAWRYEKNGSINAGSDAAFVDEIICGTNNYAGWKSANFTAAELANPAISGPNADPDHDGLSNAWECVLGLLPKTPDSAGRAPSSTGNPAYLELQFERVTNLPVDVTISLYGATGLSAWSLLSAKTGSGPWSTPALITETSGGPGRTLVKARDSFPIAGNPLRQIKVEVSVP